MVRKIATQTVAYAIAPETDRYFSVAGPIMRIVDRDRERQRDKGKRQF